MTFDSFWQFLMVFDSFGLPPSLSSSQELRSACLFIMNLTKTWHWLISKPMLVKLVGVCGECHLLWVSGDCRVGPIYAHPHMDTFLQSAEFAHCPVPPVHITSSCRAAEELICLGVVPLEESFAAVAAEDLVVPPPGQVPTHFAFWQGEVHGWIVTSSIEHC